MIFVDDRKGSVDLAKYLRDALLVRLEFADVFFEGNGPNGIINIGVERKQVSDLIQSIMTGRLSGFQIPGMLHCYDKIYVIVEGIFSEKNGLEVLKGTRWVKERGRLNYAALWGYLADLEDIGITVRTTTNLRDTAMQIQALQYRWSKPWDKHRGLKQVYRPATPTASLRPLSQYEQAFLRVTTAIPGIDYTRAQSVMEHFGNIKRMLEAPEKEWLEIEGIGKVIARQVWQIFHEEKDEN